MGEKTGWSYIEISGEQAGKLKPGFKKSFRVKGYIDELKVEGLAILPMGEGDFILPLNGIIRKKIRKEEGDIVSISFEEDKGFKVEMPKDLEICLHEEKHLIDRFLQQPPSHQHYFIKWINGAKTEATRTKRIIMTVNAMDRGLNYGEMIREAQKNKNSF